MRPLWSNFCIYRMFSCCFSFVVIFFFIFPFYPPTERFGGYSDEPGIRLSSVNIFESSPKLEHRLEYFDDTSQLCRTGHDDMLHTKMGALTLILFELSPL